MKEVDISNGVYASKWGITDFYPESEEKLKELIDSGEDFDTGWFGCKKEIRYARYRRENGVFTIEVSCDMDDLEDGAELIYDALWETCKVECELPLWMIESISADCYYCDIHDETTLTAELDGNATYNEIISKTEELEEEAEKNNTEMYNRLCEIVKDYYDFGKEHGMLEGEEE